MYDTAFFSGDLALITDGAYHWTDFFCGKTNCDSWYKCIGYDFAGMSTPFPSVKLSFSFRIDFFDLDSSVSLPTLIP